MVRKAVILLAIAVMLALGIRIAWPRIEFWMVTGRFFPIRKIEMLEHPVAVTRWDAAGLHLADGRTVEIPDVSALPENSPVLREALERGVDVRQDGRIWALVRIHHWCGNDPVREHVAQVDLSDMMIFLRLGHPTTPVPDADFQAKNPGGRFSECGWNISEFVQFQAWELSRRASR